MFDVIHAEGARAVAKAYPEVRLLVLHALEDIYRSAVLGFSQTKLIHHLCTEEGREEYEEAYWEFKASLERRGFEVTEIKYGIVVSWEE